MTQTALCSRCSALCSPLCAFSDLGSARLQYTYKDAYQNAGMPTKMQADPDWDKRYPLALEMQCLCVPNKSA